ncbi:hypothetical protein NDU88_001891 [Pleurodeles waltl]|uniref:Uncharacterized protein n=1 Tax=Pleurodeles waltl TaxID=8319 RepID=A0AAV7LAX3_PLEWA|nr:hypothetical protein NDU88_001891 [Pleurodeles waltl]
MGHSFRTKRGRTMGARGRNEIESNRRAPAQRSTEQGRLREDSAGPVHARQPPVSQRTWSRRRALTSLVATGSE